MQREVQQARSELKFARLQNEDLLSKVNVEERLQELHEEYKFEIEQLNQMLREKQGETNKLVGMLERERDTLHKKIELMERELQAVKNSKEKEVGDQKLKN